MQYSTARVLEAELQQAERQLKVLVREQEQLLKWALKGFPEETVEAENKRINHARSALQSRVKELQAGITASQEAIISLPKMGSFIKLVQDRISASDYEKKRIALDMLGIKVFLDGEQVEITGILEPEEEGIATTSPSVYNPLP